jgi:hypothetical protein
VDEGAHDGEEGADEKAHHEGHDRAAGEGAAAAAATRSRRTKRDAVGRHGVDDATAPREEEGGEPEESERYLAY